MSPVALQAQPTTVTFDNPVPTGASDSYLNGTFQGINFGTSQWRWSGPYATATSRHIYFGSSAGSTRTFAFTPAARVLNSLAVYTTTNGTLTLSDGVNPTVTRTVNTGGMVLATTNWTQASTTITVGFTAGWALGVDDITHSPGGPPDTTPPTVTMTAPAAGTVAGLVTVSADAADNLGVAGVQFLIDGVAIGTEDTFAPFSASWDTLTASNGAHTLTARARDTSGNLTTSAGVAVTVANTVGSNFGFSLRFNGNGNGDIDRVKIRVDDPATSLAGPPVDVGAADFTLEFWLNGLLAENPAAAVTCGTNDNWIRGNTIVDRDRFNQDRNFGISLAGGRVVFGVEGQATGNQTICGTTNVLDGQWHHVAAVRRRSDGWMWIFVDGALQAQIDGPNGDISYPDNGVPLNLCGVTNNQPCTNTDPFIVLGAEKHDEGTLYPSYRGSFDEFRVSASLRYTAAFTRPTRPFSPDANTVGLYHFDEGQGDYIYDSSGAFGGGPSNAVRRYGGTPTGPEWLAQTPFTAAPASQVGEWAGTYTWPLITIHAALLRTGQVLTLDGGTDLNIGGTSARIWNPATNTFTAVPNTATDLFCSAHSFLPDGRLLFAGGNVDLYIGLPDANIFDPVTSSWSSAPDMNYRRWYPTTVTLGDGRILTVNGSTDCNYCIVQQPEIYNPTTNAWTTLPNAPLNITPTYPHMFLLPDGRVIVPGSDEEPMQTYALDIPTQTWTTVDPAVIEGGAVVMYQPGRLMKTGTAADVDIPSYPTVRNTYVIDMNQPSPTWRATQPMTYPRGLHTLTMLPDGKAFVTGGGRTSDGVNTGQAVLQTEMWSPDTESWTTMASMQRPRLYHSTALLLPDGRVLSAGSGRFVGFLSLDDYTAEIYSPPYLFKGARPEITSVPNAVARGDTFFVGNALPETIQRVTLVAPGAVTHGVNMSQLFVDLAFTATTGGVNVTMPTNANIVPPGYYMLFIVGANGVPSVASFVQAVASTTPAPAPTITSIAPTAANAGGAAFTLTVNGTNFIAGSSTVRWNGVNRATTYVSPTRLTAAITAADIVTAGSATVTVFTGAPGGGTSNSQVFTIDAVVNNPAPTTTSVSPATATAGGAAFTLTINGSNFVQSQSVVRWNGAARTTTFVSATQLTAAIAAADIAAAGTASVTVFTPTPGGGTSNAQSLAINNPAPATTSISPSTATAGGATFTLTVNGSGFVQGQSVVRWNGASRTTAFVSTTQLTAAITAADIATAGTASVTVFTPTPGGGTSNVQSLAINNPVPATTGLSPISAAAGGAAFTLTVNGSGFVQSQSVVRWNGANRTTTFVSATQLGAAITAADIAAAGTASVTVFTPTPGGGTSAAQTFTIGAVSNPSPSLTSVAPTAATAGSAGFTLTVTGSSFVNGSVVQWNGVGRTTTFVSATQLTAAITAADIAAAGVATVTVLTPAPGGGTSAARTFPIGGSGGSFFDDFNRANNATIGNNWTEKFPNAFSIQGNEVVNIDTNPIDYHDAIVYRPAAEDRRDVEVGLEFRALPGQNFPQVHARVQRDTITVANTLNEYLMFVDGFEPAPGRAIIARQQAVAGQFECYMLAIPFPSALTTTDRYRLRLRVTGAAPVVLEGFVEVFNGAGWATFASGSVSHDAGGTTPTRDPNLYCDPGSLPGPLTTAGAVGFAKWTTANEVLDNFHWLDLNSPNAAPTTTSLAPAATTAGGGAFTLTVNGSSFVPGATVTWNGSNRTTTFVSSTQLSAAITAADVAASGSAVVAVVNPAPGGGTSNTQAFTINSAGTPAGLVAAYSFNVGAGTAIADSSGNANNGTLANGTWSTAGRFGAAAVFNGTSSMMSVPDANSLDLTSGMTLEAWVYPTVQPSGWRTVILKEVPNSAAYYLDAGSSSSNRPAAGLTVGGTEQILYGGTRLAANTWAHLAATYDGTTQRLYVNGVQVSSRAQTGSMATSASPLRIGGNSIYGEYFQGRIDEVRIYNRALTAAEITTDMNVGVAP